MKPNVLRETRGNAGLAFTLFVLLLLMPAGCPHAIAGSDHIAELHADLIAAGKKCSSQLWPSTVALVNCYDAMEMPVIEKDAPVILQPFQIFSAKRKLLAQRYDVENAPFRERDATILAINAAHPEWLKFQQPIPPDMEPRKRQALLAQSKKIISQEAKALDAVEKKATAAHSAAEKNFANGMKEAVNEFASEVRQAVLQQRSAEVQSAAEQAQRNAQVLSFVGELAGAFLEGVAIAAEARANAAPAAITIQQQPTHTYCYAIGNQVNCTTRPY